MNKQPRQQLTETISLRRLEQQGPRGQRKDALARARSGSILCLCLDAERSQLPSSAPILEVGVIASKKQVSKKAVYRNCAKRRIRAALRELDANRLEQITQEQGLTRVRLLFVCSKDCLTLEFPQLIQNLNSSLQKVLLSLKHSHGDKHVSAPKSSE